MNKLDEDMVAKLKQDVYEAAMMYYHSLGRPTEFDRLRHLRSMCQRMEDFATKGESLLTTRRDSDT